MSGSVAWQIAGLVLAGLAPLVGVPLTVITFYLRSLREQQAVMHAVLLRRVDGMETAISDLRVRVTQFERDYTTKEEWVREVMAMRGQFEHVRDMLIRREVQHHAAARRSTAQPREESADVPDDGARKGSG
jgi:hypothetical protein